MLMLTKRQLNYVLGFVGNNDTPIPLSYIEQLYEKYGDKYYKDYGVAPFELCEENPYWKDKRGQPGCPKKGYKIGI